MSFEKNRAPQTTLNNHEHRWLEIALSLREKELIQNYTKSSESLKKSDSFSWNSTSLYNGYPSLVLLFTFLQEHYPKENFEPTLLEYVIATKHEIQTKGIPSLSLFSGLSGICFTVHHASKIAPQLEGLKKQLDNYLLDQIKASLFLKSKAYLEYSYSKPSHFYDLISGLIGIGIYLQNISSNNSKAQEFLIHIVEFCVYLVEKKSHLPQAQFQFFTSPENLNAQEKKIYPEGNYNMGIAHGAAGILSFLSCMYLNGLKVPRQNESIKVLSDWIFSQSFLYQNIKCWPVRYSPEKGKQNRDIQSLFRLGWCDGISGILRALILGSKVTQDNKMRQQCLEDYTYTMCNLLNEGFMRSPILCHGYSGLQMINIAMKEDFCSEKLNLLGHKIEHKIFEHYDSEFPLGFKDIANCRLESLNIAKNLTLGQTMEKIKNLKPFPVSQIGLLNGVVGILLTLLHKKAKNNFWTQLFLISDKV